MLCMSNLGEIYKEIIYASKYASKLPSSTAGLRQFSYLAYMRMDPALVFEAIRRQTWWSEISH